MPSWGIHLALAKKVNKKLKLEKNEFYIGNLIADVNFNPKLKRGITHFNTLPCPNCPKETLPNLEEFLNTYKKQLKNSPLLLGYYSHLLTDYFYNNYIFTNCWVQDKENNVIGIKLANRKTIYNDDKKILKRYKHNDLEAYAKYLYNNNYIELPTSFNNEKDLNYLKDKFFTLKDTKDRIHYLNNDFIKENKYNLKEKVFGLKYKMLTKEKLDKLFKECENFIIENINKL